MEWKEPVIGQRPILVFGGGIIGRRIACLWAAAGFDVNIQDHYKKKRKQALSYAMRHLNDYMQRIGSKKEGIVTAGGDFDNQYVANAWLVIDAIPTILSEQRELNFKVDLLGFLDDCLPKDCLICVDSRVLSKMFLEKVTLRRRVLNLHHYLVPYVRVIEIVRNEYTDPAIMDFLPKVIELVGALPIIAKDEAAAMTFGNTWTAFQHLALDLLNKEPSAEAIDDVWESMVHDDFANEPDYWFGDLEERFGALVEEKYTTPHHDGQSIFYHLEMAFSFTAGSRTPSPFESLEVDLEVDPRLVTCAEPDVLFVDIGATTNPEKATNTNGKIMCGSVGGTLRVLVDHLHHPYGLDIHLASETIFWTDLTDCNISACDLSGTSRRVVVRSSCSHTAPKHIAIDQLTSQVYWTQSEGTQILRSNLDGTSIEVVFGASSFYLPSSDKWSHCLALDPSKRHFYFSQLRPGNGRRFGIFRASMDPPFSITTATAQQKGIEVVFDNLHEIRGMDFVPVFDELYWSASGKDTWRTGTEIYSGDVSPVRFYQDIDHGVVINQWQELWCLKVDPKRGHVYTASMKGTLARYDLATGRNERILFEDHKAAIAGIALRYKTWEHGDLCTGMNNDKQQQDEEDKEKKRLEGREEEDLINVRAGLDMVQTSLCVRRRKNE